MRLYGKEKDINLLLESELVLSFIMLAIMLARAPIGNLKDQIADTDAICTHSSL